ncbi:MAG: GSU2403 family nucleotidyltransferase fold protein [Pseudomonadota bacterium]
MARMNTLEPMAFVRFKRWMSGISQGDPAKRRRDALQAQKVEEVVREYLPQWSRD